MPNSSTKRSHEQDSQSVAYKVPKVDITLETEEDEDSEDESVEEVFDESVGQPVIHEDELNFDPLEFHHKAKDEDEQGIVSFHLIYNDGSRENLKMLTSLKEIFSTQLPFMPKEYIWRIVFDPYLYFLI